MFQAGKEVMIKVVVQSIPAYSMGAFKLPIGLCKDIEAMICKFWWSSGDSKKIHWVKWSSFCSSKSIEMMGFRDLQKFNNATLAKQVWRLIHQKETLLFKAFSVKYFPNGCVLDAPHPKYSYAWKSILQAHDVINKGAIWRVRNGELIDIWRHRWLPDLTHSKIISPQANTSVNRVCELFVPNTKIWDPGKLAICFLPWEAEIVSQIQVYTDEEENVLIWPLTADLIAAKDCLAPSLSSLAHDQAIWKMKVPNKIRHFIWGAVKD